MGGFERESIMRRTFISLALASAFMLAAPAARAQGTPAVRAGVACLAGQNAAAFSRLLASAPYSTVERREGTEILSLISRCMRSDTLLSTSNTLLRAAAAEELYKRQFATAQAPHAPPVAVATLLRPREARTPAEVAPLVSTYALFECVSANRPDLVRAYLAADPGSEAEQAAFRALSPGLGACLPPGGSRQLALGGAAMRGVLAETLYRWSVVQRDGPASPFAAAPAP